MLHNAAGQDTALAVVAAPAGFRDGWLDGDVAGFIVVDRRGEGDGGEGGGGGPGGEVRHYSSVRGAEVVSRDNWRGYGF